MKIRVIEKTQCATKMVENGGNFKAQRPREHSIAAQGVSRVAGVWLFFAVEAQFFCLKFMNSNVCGRFSRILVG